MTFRACLPDKSGRQIQPYPLGECNQRRDHRGRAPDRVAAIAFDALHVARFAYIFDHHVASSYPQSYDSKLTAKKQ